MTPIEIQDSELLGLSTSDVIYFHWFHSCVGFYFWFPDIMTGGDPFLK